MNIWNNKNSLKWHISTTLKISKNKVHSKVILLFKEMIFEGKADDWAVKTMYLLDAFPKMFISSEKNYMDYNLDDEIMNPK